MIIQHRNQSGKFRTALLGGLAVTLLATGFALAQEPSPADTSPSAGGSAAVETERIIVTGSNIPSAQEVGTQPGAHDQS